MKVCNKIWVIALLFSVFVGGTNASAQGVASTASSPFTHDLTLGMRGSDVSSLQQFLIDTGFLKISTTTNYFGLLTKAAVGEWQALAGISPSIGYFGPLSRAKVGAALEPAPIIESIPVPSIVIPTATTTAAAVAGKNGSPVRLRIPSLGVDAGFQFNGLKPDGTMEVPSTIYDVGWYTGSPRPGEKGNSIITGHVAQIRRSIMTKQGVFYNLSQLRQGDDLYVLNDKGETIRFIVRASRLYDPTADATNIFTSTDDRAHLNIITCEGTWNQDQLSFSQRLVIFADSAQ